MKKLLCIFLLGLVYTTNAQFNLNDSLTLFMNFDYNVMNQAQNRYHGQITNGSVANFTTDANGNGNSAYTLTQLNEDILITDSIPFNSEFTVSVDIFSPGINGNIYGFFYVTEDTTNNDVMYLGLNGNQTISPACTLTVSNAGHYDQVDVDWESDTVSYSVWNNLIYQFGTDSITIFTNGVRGSSVPRTATFGYRKFGQSLIGVANSLSADRMTIDNLIIYNRRLTTTEITYYGDVHRNMGPLALKNNKNTKHFQLCPNPAGNFVYLKGETIVSVKAYSSSGQISTLNHTEDKIETAGLHSGLYTLVVETPTTTVIKNVIKE